MKKAMVDLLKAVKLYRSIKAVTDPVRNAAAAALQKKRMRAFYSKFIKKGDICFDVGANMGNRTSVFLKAGASLVVCVEPQERCLLKLRKLFGKSQKVVIIDGGLGEKEGETEFFESRDHLLSSMSKEWIAKVKETNRFEGNEWGEAKKVKLTTLDRLIKEYGIPSFCKVDVEGFEYEVFKGLTTPLKAVSFEFTPEHAESTINCINHLAGLGNAEFNYSEGESMRLVLDKWAGKDEITGIFRDFPDKKTFGDVYARFIPQE